MSVFPNRKLFLTGVPGCGKTTLIKKVVSQLDIPAYGFFTSEIRSSGRRTGFEIQTLSKPLKKGILSHVDIKSRYRVGKYGVDISAFEKIALPELKKGLKLNELLIVDEIGKMELFSINFRDLLNDILVSDISMLATILNKIHPFCDYLKQHPLTETIIVNRENRNKLVERIISYYADTKKT